MSNHKRSVHFVAGSVPSQKASPQFPLARRSPRVSIDMPVELVGTTIDGASFRHETRTSDVNANGAHLILMTTIDVEPSILMINKRSGLEAQCRLVFQKRIDASRTELGLEFVVPQPRFWGIAFPPEDWNKAERKMPVLTSK